MDQVGQFFNISKKTVRRRLKYTDGGKEAVQQGRIEANMQVAEKAFELAVSGKVPAMTMFWLKCRAGWNETKGPKEEGDGLSDVVYDTQWGSNSEQPETNPAPVQSDGAATED